VRGRAAEARVEGEGVEQGREEGRREERRRRGRDHHSNSEIRTKPSKKGKHGTSPENILFFCSRGSTRCNNTRSLPNIETPIGS
jgi:hypothetical protein